MTSRCKKELSKNFFLKLVLKLFLKVILKLVLKLILILALKLFFFCKYVGWFGKNRE